MALSDALKKRRQQSPVRSQDAALMAINKRLSTFGSIISSEKAQGEGDIQDEADALAETLRSSLGNMTRKDREKFLKRLDPSSTFKADPKAFIE